MCLLSLCLLVSDEIEAQTAPDWLVSEQRTITEPETIHEFLSEYKPIYDFRPGEKIASIGAGQGVREVVFSLMADSLTFYLQDIDPVWLNPDKLATLAEYVYNQAKQPTHTTTLVPVRGKEKETRLPVAFFDKIIIENSLHEFSFQTEILQNIRDNLKSNGRLFIYEALSDKENKRHQGCRMPMFTDALLRKLLTDTGFRFTRKTGIGLKRWNSWVYEFQPATGSPVRTP